MAGAIAEGVYGAVKGTVDSGVSIWNAYQGYKNYKYQQQLQKELFAREDSAIQRRVADAEKAGFNKWSVLGEGSSAGSAVSTTPPQLDYKVNAIDGMRAMYELAQERASAEVAREQAKGISFQNTILKNQKKVSDVETSINLAKLLNEAGFKTSFGIDGGLKTYVLSDDDNEYSWNHRPFEETPVGRDFELYKKRLQSQESIDEFKAGNQKLFTILDYLMQGLDTASRWIK